MAIQVNFSEDDKRLHIPLLWQWAKRWEAQEERIKLLPVTTEDRERDQDDAFDYLEKKARRIAKTPLTVFLSADPSDDQKHQCILEKSAIFAIPNGFDAERYDNVGPVEFLVLAGYDMNYAEAKQELARQKAHWQREAENWISD